MLSLDCTWIDLLATLFRAFWTAMIDPEAWLFLRLLLRLLLRYFAPFSFAPGPIPTLWLAMLCVPDRFSYVLSGGSKMGGWICVGISSKVQLTTTEGQHPHTRHKIHTTKIAFDVANTTEDAKDNTPPGYP